MAVTILDVVTASKQELMNVETKGDSVVHLSNALQMLTNLEAALNEDAITEDENTEKEEEE